MKEGILTSILDWNPWFDGEFPKKLLGFKRDIDIEQYLQTNEIKILEGSRRVGKSTLMYQVMYKVYKENKNILYLNFDDEILRQYSLSEVFETFLEYKEVDYLFVDEIQNCTNWVHYIRKLYDLKKLKQIWITGSNSNLIKQEYASLLTGRNITLQIFSLNFNEFLRFKNLKYNMKLLSTDKKIQLYKLFKEYYQFGAFPEVALREVNKKELLINYFEDFLFKDIVSRYNVNSIKLKELSLYLSSNSSKYISYRNLAKVLELNYNSIVDYISYYLEVYLFDMLYKYDISVKKQISNDRKVYSLDTGISNSVSFKFSEDRGRILENIVFIELKRRGLEVYYHKEKKECDFIIKGGLNIDQAIQVTTSLEDIDTRKRELAGLVDACRTYNLKRGLILTQDEEYELEEEGVSIQVLPLWKWLLLEQ
ncbi:MAG: ATP-binding protein [Candidatus Woesearchaeota archaeon]